MVVPLEQLAELMVVALAGGRRARRHDIAILQQELAERAGVVAMRFERLDIRLTGCGQYRPARRAAIAIFVGETRGREQRAAVASVPEDSRPEDRPVVSRKVRPPVVIDVVDLLPVSAAEQRSAPAARERRREERNRVGRAARRPVQQELALRFRRRTP